MSELREIRAKYDDTNITVYQAYSPAITEEAVKLGTFVPPFKLSRMTWIKPSFLWMMYRSDWGRKKGQERILAMEISREGFEWALAHSCLSQYEPEIYESQEEWKQRKKESPVRIQWDPERTIKLEKLDNRTIQIGLSGEAVYRYVNHWIKVITDITDISREIERLVCAGNLFAAQSMLPREVCYPLSDHLKKLIGAS
ncbi:MAG: DUF4291 domain-containing protein [Spirirestis rafaelensis WJT71-NPBG6]|jgi:hypothetical protein|nr:DUF4291 domain-containing protein [Spirirestis rafaelensis WJT71-NPBG6]